MTLILARNPLTASETRFVRQVLKTDTDASLVLIGSSPRWDTAEGERVYQIGSSPADHPALSWGDLYDIIRDSGRILTVS
jgi:hypothetical protein